jgi:hypothetical protein
MAPRRHDICNETVLMSNWYYPLKFVNNRFYLKATIDRNLPVAYKQLPAIEKIISIIRIFALLWVLYQASMVPVNHPVERGYLAPPIFHRIISKYLDGQNKVLLFLF